MGANTAPNIPTFAVGEIRNCSVSFDALLSSGEGLTGTVNAVEQTTNHLTISNSVVSTNALTIRGKSVAVAKAVQFSVRNHVVSGSPYTIQITTSTNSTPAQTFVKQVMFSVTVE